MNNAGQRFAVVVVNYNGGPETAEAIRSALREGVSPASILIVDNGSAAPSLTDLQRALPGIRIHENGCNAGFARAVNLGLRATESELVLLLNNDAQLSPGALAAFAAAFDDIPKLAIAGGRLVYPDGKLQSALAPLPTLTQEVVPVNFLKWLDPARHVRSTPTNVTTEVESVFGACLAVRRAALHTIGLLDEDFFFYFEEVELCFRARRFGFKVCYVPSARASHLFGHTARRFYSAARIELQRSKLTYFRKCRPFPEYAALSVFLVLRTLINALSAALGCLFTLGVNPRQRRNAGAYWTLFAWHLMGRPTRWGLPGKCPTSSA